MDSRWYTHQAILIFIFAWSKPISGEDPCLTQQILPDMDQRGINSSLGQSGHIIDDHFNIPTGGQWFRVESQHMLNDVSLIHEFKACGTVFPIYLKGSLPSIGDGVVDRIACMVGFGSECQYSMNIKIKMCGGYSVYFLQRPDSTSSAYCFLYPDKSSPKKLDIPKPAVNVSLVERVSPRFHMNVQSLEFACNFVLLSEDVQYEVTWYIDGEAINETKIANGTDIDSLVLEEGIGQLERLGVNVECAVRAIPTSGAPGNMSPRSDPFYAGVTASHSVTLHRDDPTAYIVVKPTVPIGCPTLYQDRCEVVVELILPETYSCSGNIGAVLPAGAQTCGKHIRHDEWNQEHKIYIAWLDDQTYSGHQDSYRVSLRTAVNMFNPIWSGVTLADVNVRMDDNTNIWKGKECHAICDPHMKTFDGRYYENQNGGTFIFYENDDPNKKVQIQMKVTPCNPPHHVFCVCAIAARVGGDVFVIDRCPGEYRTIFEFRSCEDHILDVRKINEHNYKIYLPSGAYLDAQLMYYTGKDVMNLHMYPSAGDTFHTRGLCGTLNGRTDDDFTQPDGNVTTDNNIFATSWRVSDDAKNLITMSADNLEKLDPWNTTENTQFCTCNGPSRNISCTRAAIATCVRQDESPVLKQNRCKERRSRSLLPFSELPNTPQTTMAGPPKQVWNATTARNYCETFLKGSASFQACAKQIPATDPSSSIDTCILDILATQTTMWASSARESLKSVCMKELKQNTTYQEAGDTPSIAQQIKEIACPNECNGHGLCNNGTCLCSTHFGAADCSIDMRAPPLIKGINIDADGTCDLNTCTEAIVEGDSFIDTENLTCHNSLYEIHNDGTETLILSWTARARYNTLVEIFCDLPSVLSDPGRDGFAYRWSIGINYDPYHPEGQTTNLTVYDGTCQSIVVNGDTRAVQMDDNYCFIHGHCVPEGSTKPSDPCWICQSSDFMSKFQWSRNGINDCHDNHTDISASGLENGKYISTPPPTAQTSNVTATTQTNPLTRSDIDCGGSSISLHVPLDLLPSGQQVTWNDPACVVSNNGTHLTGDIDLGECGTYVVFNTTHVIFENELVSHASTTNNTSGAHSVIDYGNGPDSVIVVQCVYPRREQESLGFRPIQGQVRFYEKTLGHMQIHMREARDVLFDDMYPSQTEPRVVHLNDPIYIKLDTEQGNTTKVAINVDRCLATPSPSPLDTDFQELTDNGCPALPSVTIHSSPVSEVHLSFQAFKFTNHPSAPVYVHCEVYVCPLSDPHCVTGCMDSVARTRRAATGGIKTHLVSTGPFPVADDKDQGAFGGESTALVAVTGLCAVLAVAATVFGVMAWRGRRRLPLKETLVQ